MCGLAEAMLCRVSHHATDHWGPWGNHNAKPLYNRNNRNNWTRCAGGKAAVASRNREHDSRMDFRAVALQTNRGRIFVSGPFRFPAGVPVGRARRWQITATVDAAARAIKPAGQDRLGIMRGVGSMAIGLRCWSDLVEKLARSKSAASGAKAPPLLVCYFWAGFQWGVLGCGWRDAPYPSVFDSFAAIATAHSAIRKSRTKLVRNKIAGFPVW